jgi:hypothetical protein
MAKMMAVVEYLWIGVRPIKEREEDGAQIFADRKGDSLSGAWTAGWGAHFGTTGTERFGSEPGTGHEDDSATRVARK